MLPLVQLAALEALGSQAIDDVWSHDESISHRQANPVVHDAMGCHEQSCNSSHHEEGGVPEDSAQNYALGGTEHCDSLKSSDGEYSYYIY